MTELPPLPPPDHHFEQGRYTLGSGYDEDARGALADIATSKDMTLDLARTKAARVYAATDIDTMKGQP